MRVNGVSFLEDWIAKNIPIQPHKVSANGLVEWLFRDLAAAGITLTDLNLDRSSVEKYILDAMQERQ